MKQRKISFPIDVFVTMFICGILVELTILSAFLVKSVGAKDILLLFAAICVLAPLLTIIPIVQKWVKTVLAWIKSIPSYISKHKREVIKVIVMLIVVSLVAIVLSMYFMSRHTVAVSNYMFWGVYMMSWTIVFCLVFGFVFRKKIATNIEACVFLLIMLIGATFIFAEPVTCGMTWDDQTHFDRASHIAFFYERIMPQGIYDFTDEAHLSHEKNDTAYYEEWIAKIENGYNDTNRTTSAGLMPTYQMIGYLPAALFILIGRAFNMTFAHVFMFGRLGYLLLFAILIYFSMKKLKGGKMIVATVALLPEVLFQASNYSYDSWLIGWLIFGICCFLHEIQNMDKTIDTSNIVWMIIAFYLGVGPKAVYIPLMCMCYFLPKKKFKNKKQRMIYFAVITVVILIVIASFMKPFIASNGGGEGDTRGGSDISASDQTSYILHHPFEYFGTSMTYFKEYIGFSNWAGMTSFFAFRGVIPFSITSLMILFVVAFTDKCKEDTNLRWYHRGVIAILCWGVTMLVITVMYISFTPVKADYVAGCQARYFLPMVFPLMMCLGSGKMENKTNVIAYRGTILALSTFIVLYGIWSNIILVLY